jgi:hypothetical protein
MAEDLPRTKLSEHLEKHVRETFKEKMAEMAKEKAELEASSMVFTFVIIFHCSYLTAALLPLIKRYRICLCRKRSKPLMRVGVKFTFDSLPR